MKSLIPLGILIFGLSYAQEKIDPVAFSRLYTRVAQRCQKAVVWIEVTRPKIIRGKDIAQDFVTRPEGPVTGTVIEATGYILTSYFNISGDVRAIYVNLPSRDRHKAQLVGYNARLDIALLKIDAKGLATLQKAPLNLKLGQIVMALGRSPTLKSPGITISPGIISALDRLWGLQTDVKLNFGNTGGPLVDTHGRFIGITCQINTANAAWWGQNSGVSFAITWDKIREILPDLKRGKRSGERPGFLGVISAGDPDTKGAKIGQVIEGTAAQRAGLKEGDIITEFDGKKINSFRDLFLAVYMKNKGDRVKIKVLRANREMKFSVTLGERR
jgi:S1-C subfamily serine protease